MSTFPRGREGLRAPLFTALGLVFLIGAITVLPRFASADGGGGVPPTVSCYSPNAGLTQVAFPIGGTPPHLPYPEEYQVTDDYAGQGILFSVDDSDLPAAYKQALPGIATHNVVRQSTFQNFYRVNFLNDNVREVRILIHDGDYQITTHRMTAFSATGQVLH